MIQEIPTRISKGKPLTRRETSSSGTTATAQVYGARACPPEDCGGVYGYENLLTVIQDPSHEDYQSSLEWLGGRRRNSLRRLRKRDGGTDPGLPALSGALQRPHVGP
jgi:hypothetical protein